jgi:hypothetical protein
MLISGLSARVPVGGLLVWRLGAWIPQIAKGPIRNERDRTARISILHRIVSHLVSLVKCHFLFSCVIQCIVYILHSCCN